MWRGFGAGAARPCHVRARFAQHPAGMQRKVIPLPARRLRSVDEARLIERPLSERRTVLSVRIPQAAPYRRAGLLVWLSALAVVLMLFTLAKP